MFACWQVPRVHWFLQRFVPADSVVNSLRATVSRLRIKLQKIGSDIRSLGDCYCLVWLDERDEHAENQD